MKNASCTSCPPRHVQPTALNRQKSTSTLLVTIRNDYHAECLDAYYAAFPAEEAAAEAPRAKKAKMGSVKRRGG